MLQHSSSMGDTKQLWNATLGEIETSVSKANFSTWFRHTHVIKQDDGVIYVGVPNPFVKDWLQSKYHKLILKALRGTCEGVRGIEYVISKDSIGEGIVIDVPVPEKEFFNERFPIGDLSVNKEDNLNPRYTFDTFVIGSFNELAYTAAQTIIKKPGTNLNPFFVYGPTGLGKTHLIQSVGNHLKKNGARVFYTTSEKFSLDYITSVQNNRINIFKEKYRAYDVFIMDDIQFLSNKERTQEELFHLFNVLYDNNKQIIFSSDKHHNYIPGLEDRLKSRFNAGMLADIHQPEYESRIAILKAKLNQHNFSPQDSVVEYIASSITTNIRELEGILNILAFQTQLKKHSLSVTEVREIIKNSARPKKTKTIEEIIKIAADFYNIEEAVIYKKTRRREVVKPRQIIMYLLREDFSTSFPLIGQKLGGRDHTTVIHAYEKIKEDLKKDSTLNQEINQIRAMI